MTCHEKFPPRGVRGRVRIRSGIGLGLGSVGGFFPGDFFLEPLHEYGQCDYLGVGYEISKSMDSRRNKKL